MEIVCLTNLELFLIMAMTAMVSIAAFSGFVWYMRHKEVESALLQHNRKR